MEGQGSATSGSSKEDMERMIFFEQAREQAEADYKANNNDAQALTRWGGALLELAHLRQGPEAVEYIETAVAKFEEALRLSPRKHDALWCLGNALTSQGFLYADPTRAQQFFDRAKDCFERALAEDPKNDVYRKSLEMTEKAPTLHAELQKQLQDQQQQQEGQGQGQRIAASGGGGRKEQEKGGSEFWYDVAGWGILSLVVTGWALLAKQTQAK